ncbi:MAG: hypothetical protein HY430_02210, partial [Candidatus Levybacteria bacterium]|nr:hypothetical protein [Candidatus Levybacteria bacterium]
LPLGPEPSVLPMNYTPHTTDFITKGFEEERRSALRGRIGLSTESHQQKDLDDEILFLSFLFYLQMHHTNSEIKIQQ